MPNIHTYSTNYFSHAYRQIIHSLYANTKNKGVNGYSPLHILEGTEKLIKEELVRCIWFGQHIRKDKLYTEDGSRLEILSPGWWNSEGGPDFKHAEILLEGKGLIKGNVEIHVFASDWIRHQHNKQKAYNTVCLHVVMWNDREEKYSKNLAGQRIPQLTLSKYLDAELDDVIDMIDIEFYVKGKKVNPGYCRTEMENHTAGEQWLGHFLDYAGDERILQKSKRYETWLENLPFEQTLYKAVMESLGYKENKKPFLMLASVMPHKDIHCLVPEDIPAQDKAVYLQALLLGLAGLMPRQGHLKEYEPQDSETTYYINTLEHTWNAIRPKLNQIPMTKNEWTYSGIRPANFPERRIAAISHILSAHAPKGIFHHILNIFQATEDDKDEYRIINTLTHGIQSIFLSIHDPYWSYHYTLGGKRFERPQKLLGKERTSHIFINVIIPVLLVYARRHNDLRLEKILHLLYRNYMPLPATSVIRFMEDRVLGQSKESKKIINSVRRQQGLYQIFKDFCENDTMSCNRCALYLSIITR
ncbi:MAG: DUF2851 family protein [wastewater metagenome]|nr:DUF2851 family protein [Candidatus Loosdrechtia aerotolerans]